MAIIFIIIIITIIINKQFIRKHGWNKNNVSIQNINLYELSEAIASIIKYTSIQILNCLQKSINNLLNLQTTFPIAKKRLSKFYNGHHKAKIETIPGSNYSY